MEMNYEFQCVIEELAAALDEAAAYFERIRSVQEEFVQIREDLQLGYIKLRGRWQLCLCYGRIDEPDDWKPITESSVIDRMEASKFFPQLEAAILKGNTKTIEEIQACTELIYKWVEKSTAKLDG